jgi:hypothetical protein
MREARLFEELHPESYMAPFMIANIHRDLGTPEEVALSVGPSIVQRRAADVGLARLTLAQSGTRPRRARCSNASGDRRPRYVSPTCRWIHVGLGEIDDALA